jgi:hypothetical protein
MRHSLTEKYYADLAPAVSRQRWNGCIRKFIPKTEIAPVSRIETRDAEVPLTDSFERCYVPEVALSAGVAKLAYAADSKWEFCSFCPLRNSSQPLDAAKENDLDALKPFAGLLGNF